MKIAIYIYKNFLIAMSKCIFFCFVIFFVFSLINNLSENSDFFSIISLSFLNSVQIFSYIPGFLFLLSLILLITNLGLKNELVIIKLYLSNLKIMYFILPVILVMSVVELNKDILIDKIDIKKTNLLNSSVAQNDKLIIKYNKNFKNYTLLSGYNSNQKKIDEFHNFIASDNEILSGIYVNNLNLKDNDFISSNYYSYNSNKIQKENKIVTIKGSEYNFLNHNKIFHFKDKERNLLKLDSILILFSIIFIFICIFFINFNSHDKKSIYSNKMNILSSAFLIIYGNFIQNIILSHFELLFQLTIMITLLLLTYKLIKNV